jgi:formamidopyrimidine-DNA glycosylase
VPELPEVEVVRAGLERHVLGRTLESVEVLHPRPVRRDHRGPAGFAAALAGRRIEAVRRRGKYFWLALAPLPGQATGDALLGHLGMSGQMLLHEPGAPDERHLRVRFLLSPAPPLVEEDAPELGSLVEEGAPAPVTRPLEMRFVDQRMFGGLAFSEGGAELPPEIVHIARDPIDPEFDDDAFVRRARRRTSAVKRLLLDQGLISGVGNIYADEALWRAGLHGERPGDRLTGPVLRELLGHVRDVMGEALAQGGTSFDALYVNVNGESGYFDRSLDAYGQEGRPCRRCGTPIRRVAFMNRSSYFCPRCQRPPRSR